MATPDRRNLRSPEPLTAPGLPTPSRETDEFSRTRTRADGFKYLDDDFTCLVLCHSDVARGFINRASHIGRIGEELSNTSMGAFGSASL